MSILASATTGKINKPPIVGLSSKPGKGKSTFASQAPKPFFLCTEEGSNELDVTRSPVLKTWEDMVSGMGELIREPHDFKTAVFDTLDLMEMLIWKAICERDKVKSIELAAGGYGKGYKVALEEYWTFFFDGIRAMRDQRGMGIILLCHATEREYTSPTADSYQRHEPKLYVSSNGKLDTVDYVISQCDAWGFITDDVKTIDADDGDRKRAVGNGKRLIWWDERPTHLAKNRFGIVGAQPFEKDTSFSDFANLVKASKGSP